MQEVTLQQLLEAGCHFGHKAERWNPRAKDFIYTEKDGVHIIDLAKTKAGLVAAMTFIIDLVASGGEVIFVGTKRQAKEILKKEALAVGAPYFSERWIGGFLTNWEEIKKNIDKLNTLTKERSEGSWKKFPKHEQSKMGRYCDKLNMFYGGVAGVTKVPQALFVIDVKKEISSIREAERVGIPVIGIVDTNSDPSLITYSIPANDDAVGSISLLASLIAQAYQQGKKVSDERKAQAAREIAKKQVEKPVQKKEIDARPENIISVADTKQEYKTKQTATQGKKAETVPAESKGTKKPKPETTTVKKKEPAKTKEPKKSKVKKVETQSTGK